MFLGGFQMNCHRCGNPFTPAQKISRQETCLKCGEYLHCCLNCRFYSETAYQKCREEQAEYVNDKHSANFCEYFTPSDSPSAKSSEQKAARDRLDGLFKKK